MFQLSQKVTVPRGRKGERPDFYAGKVASHPRVERVNGRLTEVADVITAEQTLAGEWRLVKRLQDLQYVFPIRRPDAAAAAIELLDGTPSEPKAVQTLIAEQALAAMEWLDSRPAAIAEMDVADIEA